MRQSFTRSLKMGFITLAATSLTAVGVARANSNATSRVLPGTVLVVSPQAVGAEIGAGALINKEQRTVVTAWHVVESRPDAVIYFPTHDQAGELISDPEYYKGNTALAIKAHVVAADASRDVAVLQLDWLPPTASAIPLAPSDPQRDDDLHAIGNSGIDDGTLWRFSSGKVRSVHLARINYKHDNGSVQHVVAKVVEMQCPTNPGDSGGPIANDKGELVAITSGSEPQEAEVEYGIDVSEIKVVLANAHLSAGEPDESPLFEMPPVEKAPAGGDVPPAIVDLPPSNVVPPASDVPPANPVLGQQPSARIISVRKMGDVVRAGERGMEFHVNVQLDNAQGDPCHVEAIFADENGRLIPAQGYLHSTPDGKIRAAQVRIVPNSSNANFADVVIFMPYSEVTADNDSVGVHTFQISIDVFSETSQTWITQTPGHVTFNLNVTPAQ